MFIEVSASPSLWRHSAGQVQPPLWMGAGKGAGRQQASASADLLKPLGQGGFSRLAPATAVTNTECEVKWLQPCRRETGKKKFFKRGWRRRASWNEKNCSQQQTNWRRALFLPSQQSINSWKRSSACLNKQAKKKKKKFEVRCLGLAVLKILKGAKEKQRFNPKDPKSVNYLA